MAEQWVCPRWHAVGGRGVNVEHSHLDIAGTWVVVHGNRSRIGSEHFEHERGGVVRDASEVDVNGWHIGQAEEGRESAVCIELDAKFLAAHAASIFDRFVQKLHNLRCESLAGYSSHGLRCIVREVPLLVEGQGLQSHQRRRSQEVAMLDRAVVDFAHIDVIPDCRPKLVSDPRVRYSGDDLLRYALKKSASLALNTLSYTGNRLW